MKNVVKIAILAVFFEVLEVFSHSAAWSQLVTMDIYSTNIHEIFETSHSSGSVLIRNLIFSTEFVIYGKIFSQISNSILNMRFLIKTDPELQLVTKYLPKFVELG